MLVLTRKVGEKILIGKNVWVQVLKIGCGQVRIALSGPDEVVFLRGELVEQDRLIEQDRLKKENGQTAENAGTSQILATAQKIGATQA